MRLAAILVSLFPVVAARHHHMTLLKTILKPKGNFYTDINIQIQNIVNGVFDKLNLGTALHNKTRVKLLLTMHYDLKTVAERNYDVYETMKVAAKPDNNTARSHTADKISEIINDLIEDEINNKIGFLSTVTDKIIVDVVETFQTTIENKYTEFKSDNMTTPIFRDSKEFDEFIKGFVQKVDKLSVKDFYEGPGLPDDAAEKKSTFEDIQVWEPPDILELDYVNDTDTRRIYRGKRTKIKKYPFMASVHIMGQFACAGSIIARDLVLSAASCLQLLYNNRFYRENPKSIFVRIGSDFYSGGGEKIDVVETYFHPSYDPKTLKHNLVILRMQKLVRFMQKQKRVKRILIDRNPTSLPTNTNGILILGWGARKHSHVVEPYQRLTVAQLDFYHLDECANIFSRHYVSDLHFCAGFISTGGGACNKDVGGPGIVGGILVGVVSFGAPTCGTVDAPTVFTKLGFYTRWIDSIIDQDSRPIGMRTTVRAKMNTEITVGYPDTETMWITPPTAQFTYRAHDKHKQRKHTFFEDALQEQIKYKTTSEVTTTTKTTTARPVTTRPVTTKPILVKLIATSPFIPGAFTAKPNTIKLLTAKSTTKIQTTPVTSTTTITINYFLLPVTTTTTQTTSTRRTTTTTVPITTTPLTTLVTTVPETTTSLPGIPETSITTSKKQPETTTVYSKPNLLQTTLYTIVPEAFYYQSEEKVTFKLEISKVDPKYYDSYEYKYESTTPAGSVMIPAITPTVRSMFLREGGTYDSYQGQDVLDHYDMATPINKLRATTYRYGDYYEVREQIGMQG